MTKKLKVHHFEEFFRSNTPPYTEKGIVDYISNTEFKFEDYDSDSGYDSEEDNKKQKRQIDKRKYIGALIKTGSSIMNYINFSDDAKKNYDELKNQQKSYLSNLEEEINKHNEVLDEIRNSVKNLEEQELIALIQNLQEKYLEKIAPDQELSQKVVKKIEQKIKEVGEVIQFHNEKVELYKSSIKDENIERINLEERIQKLKLQKISLQNEIINATATNQNEAAKEGKFKLGDFTTHILKENAKKLVKNATDYAKNLKVRNQQLGYDLGQVIMQIEKEQNKLKKKHNDIELIKEILSSTYTYLDRYQRKIEQLEQLQSKFGGLHLIDEKLQKKLEIYNLNSKKIKDFKNLEEHIRYIGDEVDKMNRLAVNGLENNKILNQKNEILMKLSAACNISSKSILDISQKMRTLVTTEKIFKKLKNRKDKEFSIDKMVSVIFEERLFSTIEDTVEKIIDEKSSLASCTKKEVGNCVDASFEKLKIQIPKENKLKLKEKIFPADSEDTFVSYNQVSENITKEIIKTFLQNELKNDSFLKKELEKNDPSSGLVDKMCKVFFEILEKLNISLGKKDKKEIDNSITDLIKKGEKKWSKMAMEIKTSLISR